MTSLAQYDRARAALAEIASVNDAVSLLDELATLRHQAKRVQDRVLMADAAELQFRAETRLGELLIEAEKRGLLRVGRPKKPTENTSEMEGFTLKEIGVGHKLSASSQHKASISERAQLAMIERMRDRILSGGATIIDQVASTEEKKQHRSNRERVLGGMQCALPDKRYGVIYADPEWRFEVYSRDTGMDRAADNHYPTSATDEICQRPVAEIAADDCALFLWATVPMLPDALKVMSAWGFEYKSHCIWTKDRVGTGYWFRNAHELLLVGTKGKIPAPAMGMQWPSTIEAKVGKHSAKPDRFYDLIEEYFPSLPKIELNARRLRDGWDSWGNEAVDAETGEITESRSPMTDDSTSKHSLSLEPNTGEPAPVVVTGAGSLSSSGVLV